MRARVDKCSSCTTILVIYTIFLGYAVSFVTVLIAYASIIIVSVYPTLSIDFSF